MIDMLARDEARSLRMRRAELREVIDRGGADAEAAAAELAEVDARLDEIPLGDTPAYKPGQTSTPGACK